jgi:hypothetical protein
LPLAAVVLLQLPEEDPTSTQTAVVSATLPETPVTVIL